MSDKTLMIAWRLQDRHVVVIGGGVVATGRVRLALDAGAQVSVISLSLSGPLSELVGAGEVTWLARQWDDRLLEGADLVLSAVSDTGLSIQVAAASRAAGIPVNTADQPDRCDFWFPSIVRDGPVQVAITTGGNAPALAARLRRRMQTLFPANAAKAVERFGVFRRKLRAEEASGEVRMDAGTQAAHASWDDIASWTDADIAQRVADRRAPRGRVQLIGAGPGDPELLTLRAAEALAEADVVFADRLVPTEILALVQGDLRVARKFPGRADAAQAELDTGVAEAYRAGKHVVRLKCGDPFVFGRGGEEVETLGAQGIEAEVIPGISSALAAPEAAGIPLTQRGVADRVTVLTGHGSNGRAVTLPEFDPGTTVVWLMAMGRLEDIAAKLIREEGYPTNWPVAIIQHATHPGQRAVRAPLHAIAAVANEQGLSAPAVIVMGNVVNVAGRAAFEVDMRALEEVLVA